jgi:hypothetical protein
VGRRLGRRKRLKLAVAPSAAPSTEGRVLVSTATSELTNISPQGFWLLLDGRELFPPFEEFPGLWG